MKYGRQVLGIIGLLLGVSLYQMTLRLPDPWESVAIGLYFVILGALAFWYAQGERWIQVLGMLLIAFGIIRAFLR